VPLQIDFEVVRQSGLLVSDAFRKDYEAASSPMRHAANSTIDDVAHRIVHRPKEWLLNFKTLKGVDDRVLELEPGAADRILLVHERGRNVLWRLGHHEITTEVTRTRHQVPQLGPCVPVTDLYKRVRGVRIEPQRLRKLKRDDQLAPEWMWRLDSQQHEVAASCLDKLFDVAAGGRKWIGAIVGPPGTGKSAILLWLINELLPLVGDGLDLRLFSTAPVRDMMARALDTSLDSIWCEHLPEMTAGTILLVDDPIDMAVFRRRWPRVGIVAGFDPLQCYSALTDDDLGAALEIADAIHELSLAYRQREGVGQKAKESIDVLAESSPFLDVGKQAVYRSNRLKITRLGNDMEFVNPGGDFGSSFATIGNVRQEAKSLRDAHREGRLWKHNTPVLVVTEQGAAESIVDRFLGELTSVSHQVVGLRSAREIQGLEFQVVVLFVRLQTYRWLTDGYTGSGKREHESLRRLRIPLTRAKDRLTIFHERK
jgi:hypothetical protein